MTDDEMDLDIAAVLDLQGGRCDCCHQLTDPDDAELWSNPDGADPKALCWTCSDGIELVDLEDLWTRST
jgi:hypothetical protein